MQLSKKSMTDTVMNQQKKNMHQSVGHMGMARNTPERKRERGGERQSGHLMLTRTLRDTEGHSEREVHSSRSDAAQQEMISSPQEVPIITEIKLPSRSELASLRSSHETEETETDTCVRINEKVTLVKDGDWTSPRGGAYTLGVGVLEERPDPRAPDAPPARFPAVLMETQALEIPVPHKRRVILRYLRLRCFKAVQRLLSVPMLPVVHPAARLHVRLVDAPKGELLLEQRPADVVGTVEFPGPVVVEDEGEDRRVSVEEELVGLGVVVEVAEGVRFCEPGQARSRQRLQRAPLMTIFSLSDGQVMSALEHALLDDLFPPLRPLNEETHTELSIEEGGRGREGRRERDRAGGRRGGGGGRGAISKAAAARISVLLVSVPFTDCKQSCSSSAELREACAGASGEIKHVKETFGKVSNANKGGFEFEKKKKQPKKQRVEMIEKEKKESKGDSTEQAPLEAEQRIAESLFCCSLSLCRHTHTHHPSPPSANSPNRFSPRMMVMKMKAMVMEKTAVQVSAGDKLI
ncbi:hypothetical protein DNTS_026289, partial [Danionella cerebrum]